MWMRNKKQISFTKHPIGFDENVEIYGFVPENACEEPNTEKNN